MRDRIVDILVGIGIVGLVTTLELRSRLKRARRDLEATLREIDRRHRADLETLRQLRQRRADLERRVWTARKGEAPLEAEAVEAAEVPRSEWN